MPPSFMVSEVSETICRYQERSPPKEIEGSSIRGLPELFPVKLCCVFLSNKH